MKQLPLSWPNYNLRTSETLLAPLLIVLEKHSDGLSVQEHWYSNFPALMVKEKNKYCPNSIYSKAESYTFLIAKNAQW